jgi:azurin
MIKPTLLIALLLGTGAAIAEDLALELKPSPNPATPLGYDKTELTAKAGQKIKLTFSNNGGALPQPHNFILVKPGTLDKVGGLVNTMMTDPKGMEKSYVPDTPDILVSMKLVQPGATETIEFTAPAEPGDYPYACTFPGHWLLMRGIMKVTK